MTIRGEAPSDRPAGVGTDLTQLLSRIAARDATAFSLLYKQTSAKLYGVVARILTRGDVAADVLQEVYVRIWEKAGEFIPSGDRRSPGWRPSPGFWCARRSATRAPVALEDQPEGFRPAAEEVDPLAARERSEGLTALVDWSKALDEEKRSVVLLAYYRGLSREALSKRFGRPVPTIKTWLHRSLAQLRDCLAS